MKIPLLCESEADSLIATGDKLAVSRAEFLGLAISLGRKLARETHDQGGYIVNLCRDRFNFLLVFSATLIAGKTNIHPPNKQSESLLGILESYSGARCISDEVEAYSAIDCLDLTDILKIEKGLKLSMPEIDADHLAAIAFTSGSTGEPQANKKTWRTFVGTTERLARRFGFYSSRPVIVGTVPSQHMYGLEMTILMALHGNCTLYTGTPFFPKDIAGSLASVDQNKVLVTTPVHLRAVVEAGLEMPVLEKVVSATAPLSTQMAASAEDLYQCHLEEIYGCTEGGSIATRRTLEESSWKLLDGMKVKEVAEGEAVLNAEHLSEAVCLQDRLRVLTEQSFELLGRSQDMLNIGGKRYSLADLLTRILEIEGIEDAFVFMPDVFMSDDSIPEKNSAEKRVPDVTDRREKIARPVAVVVADISERQIVKKLSEKVDPVFIPRPIKRVHRIPRNETGKVVREQMLKVLDKDNV